MDTVVLKNSMTTDPIPKLGLTQDDLTPQLPLRSGEGPRVRLRKFYKSNSQGQLNRREFLRNAATAITGALLVACGAQRTNDPPLTVLGPQATPPQLLPSPQPRESAETGNMPTAERDLADFLALSVLLTGVPDLTPTLGQVYLQSLQANPQFAPGLADLFDRAGVRSATPPTLADVEAMGLFDQAERRALADTILELWYTGIYQTAEGEEQVATFVDALAWQTLTFTKPMTWCGWPGFWSEAPEPALD